MEESQVDWNMADTLEQLGGDHTLFQEVMEIFLREAPQHLAALGLAVEQGDAEKVESMAHTIKGELGYLGVPGISRKARELEEMGHSRNVEGAAMVFSRFESEMTGLFRSVRSSAPLAMPPQASAPLSTSALKA